MHYTHITTHSLNELKGQRVRVTFHDGEDTTGVLQGVTSEQVYFAGQPGGLIWTEINDIRPEPLFCDTCGDSVNVLHDGQCASCFRKAAAAAPTPQEPCEHPGCDRAGVRNPGSDQFLCAEHHATAGTHMRLHGGAANVLAECYTEDVSSPKHDWKQTRGARFRCIRCQKAEKWDPNLLREIRA